MQLSILVQFFIPITHRNVFAVIAAVSDGMYIRFDEQFRKKSTLLTSKFEQRKAKFHERPEFCRSLLEQCHGNTEPVLRQD
jgi:hypothetical protein